MFSGIQAKIIAALAVIVGFITTIAGVYLKGKATGADEVRADAANDLLDDIQLKNEISDEVEKDIANQSRDERINSL